MKLAKSVMPEKCLSKAGARKPSTRKRPKRLDCEPRLKNQRADKRKPPVQRGYRQVQLLRQNRIEGEPCGGAKLHWGLGCNPSKSLAVAQIQRRAISSWSEQRLHCFQIQEREAATCLPPSGIDEMYVAQHLRSWGDHIPMHERSNVSHHARIISLRPLNRPQAAFSDRAH